MGPHDALWSRAEPPGRVSDLSREGRGLEKEEEGKRRLPLLKVRLKLQPQAQLELPGRG